ncbi:MAG: 16S rRNA (uracil(1498)-N(3))-methyltransferase [Chlamydiia bacterium]|nr:16S rRNA (uracil(1498)-N(3))-methyltransferase [Chlamydiia bacterium]
MPVDRFYLNASLQGTVTITDTEHHHIHVLRLAIDETVELINGQGDLAQARIVEQTKSKTVLHILTTEHQPPPYPKLGVAIPLMRPSKLEWVLEKGTELGADVFYLYTAEHSEKESLSEHQRERLCAIAVAAMKQSGRLYLPHIEILPNLEAVFRCEAALYFGDVHPQSPWLQLQAEKSPFHLFITGPEKGFSEKEHALLTERAKGRRLSHNILRAETAPIAALALLSVLVQ